MKKYLLLVPSLLYPYLVFALGFWGSQSSSYTILIPIPLLWLAALVCDIIYLVMAFWKKWSARGAAIAVMTVKLLHIFAYAVIFLAGMLTFAFMPTPILLFLFDCTIIALTGILGIVAAVRCEAEKKLSPGAAAVCALLSFVFCLDVICSVVVCVKACLAGKKTVMTDAECVGK